ncbi:MAG: cell division protein FtsA [Rickettsiales bacterium]
MKFKKNLKFSPKNNIVSILDIGSSKIVCLIASIIADKVQILGIGCHSANGFKNCNITNNKLAKMSIISAVDQAEKAAGITIENIVLALNGNKIQSHYIKPGLILKKNKVSDGDIFSIIGKGIKELEKQGYEVIHYFPLEYIVDDNNGILDPTGLLGNKLSARIHFVTIASSMLENIINCLASCQLNVEDCVFAPYAAAIATLNETDKEFGSTLIDFGSGLTSYAIFTQNNMVNCGFIPVGGAAITNDIAKSFMLDYASAERIKTLHGSANIFATDYEMINYKLDSADNDERNILKSELNHVINARLEETLTLLKTLLDKHNNLATNAKHNLVIIGGGSQLNGITAEVTRLFKTKVKLGKTIAFPGMAQGSVNASIAPALGVVQYLLEKRVKKSSNIANKDPLIVRIFNWLKENF